MNGYATLPIASFVTYECYIHFDAMNDKDEGRLL